MHEAAFYNKSCFHGNESGVWKLVLTGGIACTQNHIEPSCMHKTRYESLVVRLPLFACTKLFHKIINLLIILLSSAVYVIISLTLIYTQIIDIFRSRKSRTKVSYSIWYIYGWLKIPLQQWQRLWLFLYFVETYCKLIA